MPPRHGQSQFISPVSSLKAPCSLASSSRSEGEPGAAPASAGVVTVVVVVEEDDDDGGDDGVGYSD